MRVGLFSDTYKPDINGVSSSVEALNEALTEAGNTVYVVTSGLDKEITMEDNVIRLPGRQLKSIYGYTLTTPWHRKALEMIRELNLDIIHVHTEFGAGLFGKTVARKLNLPLVLTYHTFYEDYTHYANPLGSVIIEGIEKGAVRALSSRWCNNCDHLIVPTDKTRDRLRDYGVKTDISIIPTSIDLRRFLSPEKQVDDLLDPDVYKLVFVGRLAEEKKVADIIRAVGAVNKAGLKVGLIVVGDGPDYHKLQILARNQAPEGLVVFTGKVPHDEVAAYYRKADCFISASLSETQGMTFIEAMACGLPVLACDEIALKDVLQDGVNGFYFQSVDQLKGCIRTLITMNETERETMKQSCLDKAREYSLENFAARVLRVYRNLVKEQY